MPPTASSLFLSVYTPSSLTSIGIDILGNWQDSHLGGLTVVTEAIIAIKVELKAFYQNKNKELGEFSEMSSWRFISQKQMLCKKCHVFLKGAENCLFMYERQML